ncbi:glutathione S-transferase family protein [Pseudomonas entomophila]|jgi:glutathione S-transferase|uniref:glutathione S-transferase family protein n=1 Tax=Pseudomonas entomophila TaxID=312306 RepID=UPI0015E43CCA|nr:glutathione S-transferase family protein [Pseudomonas entomophila]MBA1194939.1 glutathione S-transferase family protein [Pseudomonas entomophila]
MQLFISSTSPFARIVRILLQEKQLAHEAIQVDPWSPPPALREANPACKVPVLIDKGVAISHSLMIVQYLESTYPERALPPVSATETAQTAMAFVALEAFASLIIGRRSRADFDTSPVGQRRRDGLAEALRRLEAQPPALVEGGMPNLLQIVAVVLLEAVRFRFGEAPWVPVVPRLTALCAALGQRPSFQETRPFRV